MGEEKKSDFNRAFNITCGIILALLLVFVIVPTISCIACTTCMATITDQPDTDPGPSVLYQLTHEQPQGDANVD